MTINFSMIVELDLFAPLNSMPSPCLPPKTAILVLCCSFIKVLNIAQVEAQFPLLTVAKISVIFSESLVGKA
jgi:hypothetical protein